MGDTALLYGASGYSGRLILEQALRLGLRPILAGRDAAKLAPLAEEHGLPIRVASLQDSEGLVAILRGVAVVFNAAGPFSGTSHLLADACLRAGAHYLDITGEPRVIEALAGRHASARAAGVMLLPGVGFDVVASDCLAAHVGARLPGAQRLFLGIQGLALMSRGSARSFAEQAGIPVVVRQSGRLVPVAPGSRERAFDYGQGLRSSSNVSWGDVVTAHYTTGIPNVEVYFDAPPSFRLALLASRWAGPAATSAAAQVWLKAHAEMLPPGPTAVERDAVRVVIVAEAERDDGRRVVARLETPQSYSFTALSAAAVLARVVRGDFEVGFQTPGRLFGADFVLSLDRVAREDVV